MALIHNCNLDPKRGKPATVDTYFPFAEKPKTEVMRVSMEQFAKLFVNGAR